MMKFKVKWNFGYKTKISALWEELDSLNIKPNNPTS